MNSTDEAKLSTCLMVSPLRVAWRLTLWSYYETPVTVKLLLPTQQSWGVSHFFLAVVHTVASQPAWRASGVELVLGLRANGIDSGCYTSM
jgi:hypothetical protein